MHTRPDLTALDVIVPVGHVSAECRHERNANRQGDMHAYGNWMGRKPLALLNALIIAAHLPATVAPTLLLQQLLALLECDQTALDARDPVGASTADPLAKQSGHKTACLLTLVVVLLYCLKGA